MARRRRPSSGDSAQLDRTSIAELWSFVGFGTTDRPTLALLHRAIDPQFPLEPAYRSRNVPPFAFDPAGPVRRSLAPPRKRRRERRRLSVRPVSLARGPARRASDGVGQRREREDDGGAREGFALRVALPRRAGGRAGERPHSVRAASSAASSTTSGRTARTCAASGGERRWRAIAPRRRSGRRCSISTRSRKAEKANWVWQGADCALPGRASLPAQPLRRRRRRRHGARIRPRHALVPEGRIRRFRTASRTSRGSARTRCSCRASGTRASSPRRAIRTS